MKKVKQRHDKGCGQACVAMLAHTTFKEVNDYLKEIKDAWFVGTKTREVRMLLKHFGVNTKGNRLIPLGKRTLYDLPETCLLKLAMWLGDMGYSSSWHWIVLHKGKIYDPALGRPFPVSRFFDFYEKHDVVTSFLEIKYEDSNPNDGTSPGRKVNRRS